MKWDIEDIKAKRDKLKSMINDNLDSKDKEIIVSSFFAHDSMLSNSGTIRYTYFYNMINFFTANKFHLVKEKELRDIYIKVFNTSGVILKYNFIEQLFELFKVILKNKCPMVQPVLARSYFSDEDLINIATDFYKKLDLELYDNVLKVVDENNKSMNFNNSDYISNSSDTYGRTFYDNYHNKVYCSVKHHHTYMDVISTAHELMHANQYYFNNQILQKRFPYAGEIEPKVIELLMLDYLEEKGYDKIEIEKIRLWRSQQLTYAAYLLVGNILGAKKEKQLSDINYVNSDFTQTMMTTLTSLVAQNIYNEIKNNKEIGINKLKELMKEPIMFDEQPNIDFLGLNYDSLLDTAKIVNSNINRENNKEMKYNINR